MNIYIYIYVCVCVCVHVHVHVHGGKILTYNILFMMIVDFWCSLCSNLKYSMTIEFMLLY